MRLEHIALWTADIERLRAFYVDHFGCTASAKYRNEKKGFTSYFLKFPDGGRIEIMHSSARAGTNHEQLYGYAHFALSMGSEAGVVKFTEHLSTRGVIIESQPRWTGDGYFESVARDPDGNLVEIVI